MIIKIKGGPGSGHYGHRGRPGIRGGSLPGKGGGSVDAEFASSPVGETLAALSKDYDFVVMGSAALRLHLGEDMGRLPHDLDVVDLSQKRANIDSDRWIDLSDPRQIHRTEMGDAKTGATIQHYDSGQVMDTIKGIRAPNPHVTGVENIGGYKVLPLKTVIELKLQALRDVDEQDVENAILALDLPKDYIDHWAYKAAWDMAHGID